MKTQQFQLHADVEELHWWFLGRRRIMRDLTSAVLSESQGSAVVDIGCGTGANIAALAGDYACTGIDSSAEAIEIAAGRFPEVRFVCGNVPADVPQDARHADMYLCMDVLEHIADDFAFFSTAAALTKPGSHILVTVPAFMDLWSPHDASFGHYRRYDFARFRHLWQGLPFAERLVSAFNSRLYLPTKLVREITRRRGVPLGSAGTDFQIPIAPLNALLTRLYVGESARLLEGLDSARTVYTRGVSLIALLRREHGVVEQRTKPADVEPDVHEPEDLNAER